MLKELVLEKVGDEKVAPAKLRCLPFRGAKNFRDLGGYATADGHTVRWNVLYRSDALHKLTEADLHQLSVLELDRLIDFRAAHEVEHEPDRLPLASTVRAVAIPILDSSTKYFYDARDDLAKHLRNIDAQAYMVQINVELATRFTPEFKLFLHDVLAANGRPLLFHCAAGKDRTGFAAAILLRILGVPQSTVMEDYLLTNAYFLRSLRWSLILARLLKGKKFADVLQGFMEARTEYLIAAFDELEREHGSFENYVRNGLGLTEQDIERLKNIYLE